ncbi:MAG: DUF1330 domain-containing protein [Acidobacteriota bacterium]|nr:DUF1330 domain-containing protein [Acidobacteriota bacterium]
MPVHIIVEISVTDPQLFEDYKKAVPATLTAFGGRFVVRGGECETLEGNWKPERLVVLEFDSVDHARAWWSSEAYSRPKRMRQKSAITQMVLVQPPPT